MAIVNYSKTNNKTAPKLKYTVPASSTPTSTQVTTKEFGDITPTANNNSNNPSKFSSSSTTGLSQRRTATKSAAAPGCCSSSLSSSPHLMINDGGDNDNCCDEQQQQQQQQQQEEEIELTPLNPTNTTDHSTTSPHHHPPNNNTNSMLHHLITRIETITFRQTPLLTGLHPVLSGSLPASQSVRLCNTYQPPRYLFYMLSGSSCDVIQFAMDAVLYYVLDVKSHATCWAISFTASIVFRHSFHRYLVFGDYVGGYWWSLGKMYMGYALSIVLSTVLNVVMSRKMGSSGGDGGWGHEVLWGLTMIGTGVVNYFVLKRLWSFDGGKKRVKTGDDDGGDDGGGVVVREGIV